MSTDDAYPFDRSSDYPAARIAEAWERERPGVPTNAIGIVTPLWRLAKLLGDERRRILAEAGVEPATLDLLSVLRRAGPPYELTTRQLTDRTLVTAGAITQRVARAQRAGLVTRRGDGRSVVIGLTPAGHALIEATVDELLTREAELVGGISAAEQRQLGELLERLVDSVRARR
jgi:DNA-binding MarR family transcriptional regulator